MLTEHIEICLRINGIQTEIENYSRQIPAPFRVTADFECILHSVASTNKKKKNQDHIPCSFCYKLVCVDNKFSKPIVFYRVKNAAKFIKAILEEYNYCRKVMKNHFNKNSIMTEEDEETFQSSNECCGSEKRIDDQEKKVRDHCHITKKFRGAAHVNLKLAKNVFVVFHGLKGL